MFMGYLPATSVVTLKAAHPNLAVGTWADFVSWLRPLWAQWPLEQRVLWQAIQGFSVFFLFFGPLFLSFISFVLFSNLLFSFFLTHFYIYFFLCKLLQLRFTELPVFFCHFHF